MRKKAQVKFGESFGIIIIVFFIIMAGMIWYNKINTNSIKKINDEDQFNKAFEKYYYLKELDLIHSSQRGMVDKQFDLNSLLVFSNYSKTPIGGEYVRKRLDYSSVIFYVYNTNEDLKLNSPNLNIILYNNTPTNIERIKEPVIFITYFPVENDENKILIGKLEIKSYIVN